MCLSSGWPVTTKDGGIRSLQNIGTHLNKLTLQHILQDLYLKGSCFQTVDS
jgi:hypothetical protein